MMQQRTGTRRLMLCALLLVIGLITAIVAIPRATAFNSGGVQGIDIANHQHPGGAAIDFSAVARSKGYVFVKATEGTGYTNEWFNKDVTAAQQAGLRIGTYHFARPEIGAAQQAAYYYKTYMQAPNPTLPPVLDIETDGGLGPAQLQAWVREFLTKMEELTGRKPIIYTYPFFWQNNMANTKEFTDYPLWLASYRSTVPDSLPGGWSDMAFWQYSSTGQVDGINTNVDLNIFNGNGNALDAFMAGNYLNIGSILAAGAALTGLVDGANALSSQLAVYSANNTPVVSAILAVAAGVLAAGALVTVLRSTGMDMGPANQIADTVLNLIHQNALPTANLQSMLSTGTYSIGDLVRLLENAQHLTTAAAQVATAAGNVAATL